MVFLFYVPIQNATTIFQMHYRNISYKNLLPSKSVVVLTA